MVNVSRSRWCEAIHVLPAGFLKAQWMHVECKLGLLALQSLLRQRFSSMDIVKKVAVACW